MAKAVRLSEICGPGIKIKELQLVEDLHIDDYVSSHMLKNCLILLLQSLRFICADEQDNGDARMPKKDNHCCKYVWADRIYHVLQTALLRKRLNA